MAERNLIPTRKVGGAVLVGALTTIVIGIAKRSGLELSADEASALTTLLMGLAGYFVPNATPQDRI